MNVDDLDPANQPPTKESWEAYAAEMDAALATLPSDVVQPKRSLAERFWRFLGYVPAALEPPADWDLTAREGWAPSYSSLHLVITLDWASRLRLILTGRLSVLSLMRTDVAIGKLEAVTVATNMPPRSVVS